MTCDSRKNLTWGDLPFISSEILGSIMRLKADVVSVEIWNLFYSFQTLLSPTKFSRDTRRKFILATITCLFWNFACIILSHKSKTNWPTA